MSFSCPHCSKELENVVSKQVFDDRVSKLSEQKKTAEAEAAKLRALADRAAPLAAKASGYDSDADTVEMLQARYEKAAKAGYAGDLAEWLGDAEGAGKDTVAARFRSQVQTQEPAKVEPKVEPRTEPKAEPTGLPRTPTVTTAPATTPRMTSEQVAKLNEPLLAEYRNATPERRAAIKTEIAANQQKVG